MGNRHSKRNFLKAAAIAAALGAVCACITPHEPEENDIDKNSARMQKFVRDISAYARGIKPGFIVIPQNGAELAFNHTDPGDGIMPSYIAAIDGIGIEELFYNGTLNVDRGRLAMLRKLKSQVKIFVSDYVSNNASIADAISRSKQEEFIPFPRSNTNYDYKLIPAPIDANTNDIADLSDAKNYLYLISTESFDDEEKQAMLSAIKATNYDVVLIDLFFGEEALTGADIGQIKKKANGGDRLVISYISIGSAERYRYYWRSNWKKGSPSWLKKSYPGYPNEFWVEFWHPQWQNIIFRGDNSYIDRIIAAGFDGVYLDNVEAYYFLVK